MTQVEPVAKKELTPVQSFLKNPAIIESATRTLGSTKGQQFITSVLTMVNANDALANCEPRSLYNTCLRAAVIDLPLDQNLGFAYIVPYKARNAKQPTAQFQMGYKGFVQLAIRTGEYKRLGANEVYEGQLVELDPFSGEPIFDFNVKTSDKVIGYMAYFELLNGFRKASFMTKDEAEAHGKKYSQSYKNNSGVWKDNFSGMAKKTVLKLLLSKFAPLSTEMQTAIVEDQKADGEYLDNKITFEVEGATVGDEPIEAEVVEQPAERKVEHEEKEKPDGYAYVRDENLDEYSDAPFEDEPDLITDKQLKMLLAITSKLPESLQAKEKEARELNYPGRSRKTFTKQEASHHIKYVQSLQETIGNE